MKFAMPATDLARVLGNAYLFTSTDDTVEVLCGVWFEVAGGKLSLAATDRYTLSIEQPAELVDTTVDGTFSLARKDAQALARELPKTLDPIVVETRDDGLLHVSGAGRGWRFSPNHEGEFINYQHLTCGHRWEPVGAIGVNPQLLARFAKVRPAETGKPAACMELVLGGQTKLVKIHIGEQFTGLIMPVRLDSYRTPAETRRAVQTERGETPTDKTAHAA